MALQDAEYYSCFPTQSTTSEEAEVCFRIRRWYRVGYRFSCAYIILYFTFYELDPITDTSLIKLV